MGASSFLERAEGVLQRIETALGEGAPEDVQWDRTGVTLTIELSDGVRFVASVNADEERIFCSAEGEALTFTYQPDDDDWCPADGRELFSFLDEHFGQRTGVHLEF
jgi:frataxin-like iron-binding protein CyaY